jgi:hypothetical protein
VVILDKDGANIVYCVEILLPDDLEARMSRWSQVTPGATWPAWGGHITLLSRFSLLAGIEAIRGQMRAACSEFAPFALKLDRVITEKHWRRPEQAVLLVGDETALVTDPIMRLRSALSEALAPWKRDLRPEISQQPFAPHLSLTIGLPQPEAEQLALAAAQQHLAIEFIVDVVWLLKLDTSAGEDKEVVAAKEPFLLTGLGLSPAG